MFDINKIEIEWCGKKLTLETGKIARQADASVVANIWWYYSNGKCMRCINQLNLIWIFFH